MGSRHHRTGHERKNWLVSTDTSHQLGGHCFVATSDHDYSIARLAFDHFFCIHTHQISQEHTCRAGKALVYADGGKLHGQSSSEEDASFGRLEELWYIAMARIEGGKCVDDSNNWL